MTDSHAGYLVTLGENLREDDARAVVTALRMIQGVIAVEPVAGSYELAIAKQRVDSEWRRRIIDLLNSDRSD